MFGQKLKNWMEAHLGRARHKSGGGGGDVKPRKNDLENKAEIERIDRPTPLAPPNINHRANCGGFLGKRWTPVPGYLMSNSNSAGNVLSSPDTGYSTDGYSPRAGGFPGLSSFESSGKSTPKSNYTISSLVSCEFPPSQNQIIFEVDEENPTSPQTTNGLNNDPPPYGSNNQSYNSHVGIGGVPPLKAPRSFNSSKYGEENSPNPDIRLRIKNTPPPSLPPNSNNNPWVSFVRRKSPLNNPQETRSGAQETANLFHEQINPLQDPPKQEYRISGSSTEDSGKGTSLDESETPKRNSVESSASSTDLLSSSEQSSPSPEESHKSNLKKTAQISSPYALPHDSRLHIHQMVQYPGSTHNNHNIRLNEESSRARVRGESHFEFDSPFTQFQGRETEILSDWEEEAVAAAEERALQNELKRRQIQCWRNAAPPRYPGQNTECNNMNLPTSSTSEFQNRGSQPQENVQLNNAHMPSSWSALFPLNSSSKRASPKGLIGSFFRKIFRKTKIRSPRNSRGAPAFKKSDTFSSPLPANRLKPLQLTPALGSTLLPSSPALALNGYFLTPTPNAFRRTKLSSGQTLLAPGTTDTVRKVKTDIIRLPRHFSPVPFLPPTSTALSMQRQQQLVTATLAAATSTNSPPPGQPEFSTNTASTTASSSISFGTHSSSANKEDEFSYYKSPPENNVVKPIACAQVPPKILNRELPPPPLPSSSSISSNNHSNYSQSPNLYRNSPLPQPPPQPTSQYRVVAVSGVKNISASPILPPRVFHTPLPPPRTGRGMVTFTPKLSKSQRISPPLLLQQNNYGQFSPNPMLRNPRYQYISSSNQNSPILGGGSQYRGGPPRPHFPNELREITSTPPPPPPFNCTNSRSAHYRALQNGSRASPIFPHHLNNNKYEPPLPDPYSCSPIQALHSHAQPTQIQTTGRPPSSRIREFPTTLHNGGSSSREREFWVDANTNKNRNCNGGREEARNIGIYESVEDATVDQGENSDEGRNDFELQMMHPPSFNHIQHQQEQAKMRPTSISKEMGAGRGGGLRRRDGGIWSGFGRGDLPWGEAGKSWRSKSEEEDEAKGFFPQARNANTAYVLTPTESRLLQAEEWETERKCRELIKEAEALLQELSAKRNNQTPTPPRAVPPPKPPRMAPPRNKLLLQRMEECPQSDPLRRKAYGYDCWAMRRLQQELAGCCASPPVLHRSRLNLTSPSNPSKPFVPSTLSQYKINDSERHWMSHC